MKFNLEPAKSTKVTIEMEPDEASFVKNVMKYFAKVGATRADVKEAAERCASLIEVSVPIDDVKELFK